MIKRMTVIWYGCLGQGGVRLGKLGKNVHSKFDKATI